LIDPSVDLERALNASMGANNDDSEVDEADASPKAVGETSDPSSPVISEGADVSPLISVEDASDKLGANVLKALKDHFNGSLTEARYPDENDRIF